MKTAHIFAGGGGGLLADLILGHEPIYAVDNDERTCSDLIDRGEWFPGLKVICADMRTFDGSQWAGKVDMLHAGVPCPRWSTARRGRGDTYDGWPDTLRIIRQSRPAIVFLECVERFKREHGRVSSDLKSADYSLTRPLITDIASMGAPHSRRRYWALGFSHDKGQSMRRHDAKMAIMPPPDAGEWWEADPRNLRMDAGVANRVHRYRQLGNGQVPLQAAAAYLMLGGPSQMNDLLKLSGLNTSEFRNSLSHRPLQKSTASNSRGTE